METPKWKPPKWKPPKMEIPKMEPPKWKPPKWKGPKIVYWLCPCFDRTLTRFNSVLEWQHVRKQVKTVFQNSLKHGRRTP